MAPDDDDAEDLGSADAESRARTHLANERTFLAWFRTGLTIIALGVAAVQFIAVDAAGPVPLVRLIGAATVAGGSLLVLGGLLRYRASRAAIEALHFRPAGRSVEWSAAFAVVVGVLALLFVLFARPR